MAAEEGGSSEAGGKSWPENRRGEEGDETVEKMQCCVRWRRVEARLGGDGMDGVEEQGGAGRIEIEDGRAEIEERGWKSGS